MADALEAAQVADQQLAAPDRAVGAVAGAVEDRRRRRAGLAVLGEAGGEVRVVVLHADMLDARRARARSASTGSRGAGRGRRPRASTANRRSKCSIPSRKDLQRLVVAQVADVVADPRPRRPWRRRTCSSARRRRRAPAAAPATGSASARRARSRASGAASAVPLADDAHDRVVGAHVDRAVVDEEQVGDAAPAARARRRRRRRSARRRRCRWSSRAAPDVGEQQVVQRRVGQHHAEVARARGDRRRRPARPARRGGEHDRPLAAGQQRLVAPAPSSTSSRAAARSAPSARTACPRGACARAAPRPRASSSARQARWKPPSPLTATIAPARSAAPRRRSASAPAPPAPGASRRRSRGPQSGQAFGWAWKRRSAGSSYSARHAAHMAKPAIVVSGRS